MVDLLEDISILENAVISFTEGASDEKRGAMQSLESLIAKKKAIIKAFEDEVADRVVTQ